VKRTSLSSWLFALVPLAALAADPSPAAPAGPTATVAAGAPAAAGSAAEPAAALCSLDAGIERSAPSSGCIACHASTTGNFDHGGHRVEIAYEPYGKELRPKPEERGVNVVLPGGRITCLTCHDPQSKLPNHLAATTAGPVDKRLCTACHLFD
jgi:hypothetical protein